MRLAVVSDLHLTLDPATSASWHNAFDFAGLPARIDAARARFEGERVDGVLACGDLTHDGDEASARDAVERLSGLLDRPLLVVAGNHDCLERDDQLERCGGEMLTAGGVELDGVRVAGVPIEREAGRFRWTGAGEFAGVRVVASHFPVLSRAERLEEQGLAYPGDLTNRQALHERLLGDGPVVALEAVVVAGEDQQRSVETRGQPLQRIASGRLVPVVREIPAGEQRIDALPLEEGSGGVDACGHAGEVERVVPRRRRRRVQRQVQVVDDRESHRRCSPRLRLASVGTSPVRQPVEQDLDGRPAVRLLELLAHLVEVLRGG